jgi:hypothetical protein
MNDVQQEKYEMVSTKLLPLLQFATDGEVRTAKYKACGDDERVEIRFSNDYTKSVNVAGDSLLAVCRDVLRALG